MTQLISPDRLRDVLLKIQACTQRRDEALAKLGTQVNNSDHLDSCVSWIDDSFPDQIRTAAENAATMAAQVQTAGRGAETSYRNVKDMDERLARVRQSLDVVRAVAAQRESLATVGASVRNRDWEAAVSCVEKFDAVSKVLGGFTFVPPPSQPSHSAASGDGESFSSAHDGAHNSSVGGGSEDGDGGHSLGSSDVSSPLTTSSSSTIATARLQLHDDLLDQIRVARAEKKVEEVSKYCSMLARLGYMDEGRDAFTEFVVASVKDDLKTFVERALDDIKAAKTTHLMACVAVLDRIAAAMERHKSYVDTNFKGQSSALMLSLHAEATSHCVDVLKDFLKSRNAVVGRAEKGGRDNSRARSQPSNLDPRSLDQTLEDISHLLTCCHQYVSFVTSCVVSSSDSKEKQQSMRAKVRDSPLFQQLGGLMGVYVPVQTEYLDAAFRVVVQQCDQTIARVLTPISSVLSTSTASSSSSGIMGALWGGGASSNTSAAMLSEYTVGSRKLETLLADLEVSLVDDIFHLMLVAIRRAMSTRDVSIASSALMATNNVLTDLVLPELKRRIETSDASAASPVTASSASSAEVAIAAAVTARIRALWLQAAASATDYVVKLSLDAEQCAAANFTGSDVFRLTEQRHDFATTGTLMREALNGWLAAAGKRIAAVFNDSAAMSHDAANYVLKTEAAYVAAGINDNWVTLGSSAMKECVDEFQAPFPEASRDVIILSALDGILARALATVPKKNYDAFGALQLDREVRALRIFIASLTEMPIRDRFTQLQAVTQVLMADTPAEAEAEGSAAGLDKALTATLISRRVEFDSKPARN